MDQDRNVHEAASGNAHMVPISWSRWSDGAIGELAPRRAPLLVVADGSPAKRRIVREALSTFHFDEIETADGRRFFWALEGLRDAAAMSDVLLIADIVVSICKGLDVRGAWEEAHWPFTLIVITSSPDEAARARIEEAGAILLTKPISLGDLRRAVRSAVGGIDAPAV